MSVKYVTVQWTKRKLIYDVFAVLGVAVYLGLFTAVTQLTRPDLTAQVVSMRAWGTCAFLMLTLILCIGPLARLDRRFLPVLYNRRHFGVLMFVVGAVHARHVMGFYHAYSDVPPPVSLLTWDAAFTPTSLPFQLFGAGALLILLVMAVTSHDFWQKTLGARVWKGLHMGVYAAFALLVLHVAYGALQLETHPGLALMVCLATLSVVALHVIAGVRSTALERDAAQPGALAWVEHEGTRWIDAGPPTRIPKNRALPVVGPTGERIAVIRHEGRVSAIHGVCAHQGGPLYEGKVIDGCLTCPWHGWQYRPEDGCSPPPFAERVPTYRVAMADGRVLVDPSPLPPGTAVPPVELSPESDDV
ncbi:MAG: Rieske 2Fe-2S domain-containing protein [Sandaracinaceae bacterium]